MWNRILIANRGEIACRIIRTARKMGIQSVAIYSSADSNSPHVSLADSAYCIGEPLASASYLNIEAIIATALASGAEAIHPGYGFLSENPLFARACLKAGLVFIGPSVAAMEAMASKQLAKQLLEKTKIPLIPGYHGKDQSDEKLLKEAQGIGFPVLLKAASGGGGKGMRTVVREADFSEALAGARREAKASFADDTMIIEKLIINPRHIEIQIMADNYGNIVHLYERDCSIQRRHQKIIEEAPASNLSNDLRNKLADAAIEVARNIEYRGAGTIEFLVEDNRLFYFMEMNTRLQVEHPVTELITGLDLVEWQLRIAANEPLPCPQAKIHANGHAIECRIYAEDPRKEFMPSIGQLHFLQEPIGEGIRIDSGVSLHSEISRYYDPMISKLIAWGNTREEALLRLQQALRHYYVGGVSTNIPFLQAIIAHPKVTQGHFNTQFLTEETLVLPTPNIELALLMAASAHYLALFAKTSDPLVLETFAFQMHLQSHWFESYLVQDQKQTLKVTPINPHELVLTLDNKTNHLRIRQIKEQLTIEDGQHAETALIEELGADLIVYLPEGPVVVQPFCEQHAASTSLAQDHQLTAPMPSTVVAILKKIGDSIKAGDRLMVLEAMKMEHTVHAAKDGVLTDIFYDIGAQVAEGATLVAVDETPS